MEEDAERLRGKLGEMGMFEGNGKEARSIGMKDSGRRKIEE